MLDQLKEKINEYDALQKHREYIKSWKDEDKLYKAMKEIHDKAVKQGIEKYDWWGNCLPPVEYDEKNIPLEYLHKVALVESTYQNPPKIMDESYYAISMFKEDYSKLIGDIDDKLSKLRDEITSIKEVEQIRKEIKGERK